MGILANCEDGQVYHARNFDFLPFLDSIQIEARMTRNGTEVARSAQVMGYAPVFTGFKNGAFAIEINTRFPEGLGGNEKMLDNLLEKRSPLITWKIRELLENATTYEEAVETLSTAEVVCTNYVVISGPGKGTILARDPSSLEHQITLQPEDKYIIITNFDYWDHDIREWFDYTTGEIGTPRRIVA